MDALSAHTMTAVAGRLVFGRCLRAVLAIITGAMIMTGNRRHFLFASSGAAAGSFLATGFAEAAGGAPFDFSKSGLSTGSVKALKHKEIPGFLSAEQIPPHPTAHYDPPLQ